MVYLTVDWEVMSLFAWPWMGLDGLVFGACLRIGQLGILLIHFVSGVRTCFLVSSKDGWSKNKIDLNYNCFHCRLVVLILVDG